MTTHLSLRIDWSEMDMFGHINNVAYFKYIQAARVNFWEMTNLFHSHQLEESKTGSILLSTQCRFLAPLHYPGMVHVHTRPSFVKNTSFGLQHTLLSENTPVAEANDVIVYFNFATQTKIPLPQAFKQLLEHDSGLP